MRRVYLIVGGMLALILLTLLLAVGVNYNSLNTTQNSEGAEKKEQTEEQTPILGVEDETEIIGNDESLSDKTDKTEKKEDVIGEESSGDETQQETTRNETQVAPSETDDSKPVELPFVPYT